MRHRCKGFKEFHGFSRISRRGRLGTIGDGSGTVGDDSGTVEDDSETAGDDSGTVGDGRVGLWGGRGDSGTVGDGFGTPTVSETSPTDPEPSQPSPTATNPPRVAVRVTVSRVYGYPRVFGGLPAGTRGYPWVPSKVGKLYKNREFGQK